MHDFENEHRNRRQSARHRGLEYELTIQDLQKNRKAERCYYLNIPLNVKNPRFAKFTKFTLDRKNPDIGYIPENVVPSSHLANMLKAYIESGLITPNDIIKCGRKMKRALEGK